MSTSSHAHMRCVPEWFGNRSLANWRRVWKNCMVVTTTTICVSNTFLNSGKLLIKKSACETLHDALSHSNQNDSHKLGTRSVCRHSYAYMNADWSSSMHSIFALFLSDLHCSQVLSKYKMSYGSSNNKPHRYKRGDVISCWSRLQVCVQSNQVYCLLQNNVPNI